MKVLVTGGSGFLGINLIRFLRAKGVDEIRVLDIADFDYPEKSEPWLKFTLGDVRDIPAVEKITEGCDVVVHCAAALPLYSEEDIRTTEVDGSKNVLAAARKFGLDRHVQISSTAVYGVPKKHPIYEDDPMVGVGPYGHAKIDAEEACRAARREGYCVPIIRPKSFVGPERLGVFALFYDWAYTGHGFPMIGSGDNRYQLMDVEDLCSAIWAAMTYPKDVVNTEFNIGAKDFTTMREDYQAVLDRAGYGKKIRGTPVRPVVFILRILEALKLSPLYPWVYETASTDSFVSIERAERLLDYRPKYSNKDALLRNYEWYVEHLSEFAGKSGVSHRVPWKQGLLAVAKWFFSAAVVASLSLPAAAGPNADRPDARHAWAVHDDNRPNPPQVLCEEGEVPSDAIVLFDGGEKSFREHWTGPNGATNRWVFKDGLMFNTPGSRFTYSKDRARDFQLHVEFLIPDPPGDGLGNTGVFVHGKYELQVLHSYFNMNEFHPAPPWKHANYADGEIGAVYGQTPPLVTACRKAGHWQVFDIVFHPSHWQEGRLLEPARMTAFLNGVLIQDNVPLEGPTKYCFRAKHSEKEEPAEDVVVALQDHGNPCPYRLIWYRNIPSRRANTVHGGDYFNAADAAKLRARLAAETLEKAHAEENPCNRLVFLWESFKYVENAAVMAEIDELTPKYVERVSKWSGEIDPAFRQELSNMSGFVDMGVRNAMFTRDSPIYKAVKDALKRTSSKVKHY